MKKHQGDAAHVPLKSVQNRGILFGLATCRSVIPYLSTSCILKICFRDTKITILTESRLNTKLQPLPMDCEATMDDVATLKGDVPLRYDAAVLSNMRTNATMEELKHQ